MGHTKPETMKAWKQTHRARVAAYDKNYIAKNRERLNAARRERRRRNAEHIASVHKAWHRAHPKKQREYALKKMFGLTAGDYDAMLAAQDGVCAICRRPERTVLHGRTVPLSVDHDHESGAIRGLLCRTCNSMLGFCGESIDLLMSARDYLVRYGAASEQEND